MRPWPAARWLVAAGALVLTSGCLALTGNDAFAYTRQPLYTGAFDLAKTPASGDTQMFRVEDGSIGGVRLQVWVNATPVGAARVEVIDPSGWGLVDTTMTLDESFPLHLGAWTVRVRAEPGTTGDASLRVTRA